LVAAILRRGGKCLRLALRRPTHGWLDAQLISLSIGHLADVSEYNLAVQSEKTNLALHVLEAIAAHGSVSEHDAFQLRFWMSAEEALLPLDQIAQLILCRESNSQSARAGG
jgi:hypothetical protein